MDTGGVQAPRAVDRPAVPCCAAVFISNPSITRELCAVWALRPFGGSGRHGRASGARRGSARPTQDPPDGARTAYIGS